MKIYNLTISLHLFASVFQALLINYAKAFSRCSLCCTLPLFANLRGGCCWLPALLFVGDQIGRDVTIYLFLRRSRNWKQIVYCVKSGLEWNLTMSKAKFKIYDMSLEVMLEKFI